jgi:CubicO group peptidase (beta-lactamase class C family)
MNAANTRFFGSVLILVSALLASAPAGAQHFPADEDLQVMLRYLVEDGETPGIVVGVLEADGSTRIVSYGSSGPDARPLGPRSVFEIGSINKTFTATLLADMIARGEVSLEDPVSDYLPEDVTVPSSGGREITLLDLATHTSGLPRLPDNHRPGNMRDPYADYTIELLYEFLSSHELRRDPGAEVEYSNLGFGLLGHVLARAAGMSYRDLLQERVIEPLGMGMTGNALEGEVADWMTRGHAHGDVVPYWFATEAIQGAGGLRSNVEDMLVYLKANVGPPETELEQAMHSAHQVRWPIGEDGGGYGLAWRRIISAGRTTIRHGGGTGGFTTLIAFDPEKRVGIVVLTNSTNYVGHLGIPLLLLGQPLAIQEVPVDPDALAPYAGEYEFPSGRSLHVRLEDEGYLTVQSAEVVRARMYAKSDTSFFVKLSPWSCAFQKDENGEVVGLVYEIDEREPAGEGRTLTGRKVGDDSPPPAVVAGNAGFRVEIERLFERSALTVYGWGPLGWTLIGVLVLAALVAVGVLLRRTVRSRREKGSNTRTSPQQEIP